jgi:hypothetical protein
MASVNKLVDGKWVLVDAPGRTAVVRVTHVPTLNGSDQLLLSVLDVRAFANAFDESVRTLLFQLLYGTDKLTSLVHAMRSVPPTNPRAVQTQMNLILLGMGTLIESLKRARTLIRCLGDIHVEVSESRAVAAAAERWEPRAAIRDKIAFHVDAKAVEKGLEVLSKQSGLQPLVDPRSDIPSFALASDLVLRGVESILRDNAQKAPEADTLVPEFYRDVASLSLFAQAIVWASIRVLQIPIELLPS